MKKQIPAKAANSSSKKPFVKKNAFEHFALLATRMAGGTYAFIGACLLILIWVVTGPLFGFSDTWQLVINTGTTIITFLMVFLIQKTQNKDSIVIQIKLNELVAADPQASNRIISVEDLTEDELVTLNRYYTELAEMTKKETNLRSSHSIEEAQEMHERKKIRMKGKNAPAGNGQPRRRRGNGNAKAGKEGDIKKKPENNPPK
jgi:low affinity Fe/Cu permease